MLLFNQTSVWLNGRYWTLSDWVFSKPSERLTVRYQANILYLAKECREQVTFSWDDRHVCPFFLIKPTNKVYYTYYTVHSTAVIWRWNSKHIFKTGLNIPTIFRAWCEDVSYYTVQKTDVKRVFMSCVRRLIWVISI